MRQILLQLSGLTGILVFLVNLWNHAPLVNSVFSGIVVGAGVYVILLFVDIGLRQILVAQTQAASQNAEREQDKSAIQAEGKTSAEDGQQEKNKEMTA